MLTFLRTYQKSFLVLVSGVVILSFFFVGTSSGGFQEKAKEEFLVKALDGSDITKQKVERMVRFLSGSQMDLLDDKISSANWLNDGVLEKDILQTSLGISLAEKIFPEIEQDVKAALQKAHSFKVYRHPYAPFLSAGSLWSQFAPEATRIATDLMMANSAVSLDTFKLFAELYSHQKTIPLSFFKRIVAYQEKQDSKISPDDRLAHADLSLLGLHGAQDWFGPVYLKAAAQVIINGAAYAKSLGFDVSIAEAREQLLVNVQEAVKRSGEKIGSADLYPVFLNQVRKEGMEERECLELWKDIALFRKLLVSFGEKVKLDPEVVKKSYEEVKDLATLDLYSLPTSLRFKDFSSLLKLQIYVEGVSNQKDLRKLPEEMLTISEVGKKMPELLREEYVLEYKELDVKKAASQVGLKETWNWQVEDANWTTLQKKFASLGSKKAKSKEERLSILDQIEDKERIEIDAFSRESILSSDPKRIESILASLEAKEDVFLVGEKGEGIPFKGLSAIKPLLEKAALKEEDSIDPGAVAAREKLFFYTEDHRHYYAVNIVDRKPARILSFAEAESLGILRQSLDQRLEMLYPTVRKKDTAAYLQKDGSWKTLAEVKDRVGLLLFPDLCQSIQKEYAGFFSKEPTLEQKQSSSFYVQNWAIAPLRSMIEKLKCGSMASSQWDLTKETKTVGKNAEYFRSAEEFNLQEGNFSSLRLTSSGKNVFFQLVSRSVKDKLSDEELDVIKAPLKKEAEEKGIKELLEKMEMKKAYSL